MEKVIHIPMKEALEALWYINEYYGFKYPSAVSAFLILSLFQKKDFFILPTIRKERVSRQLKSALALPPEKESLLLTVLWLNANLNGPVHDLVKSTDKFQQNFFAYGHVSDLQKLSKFVSTAIPGQPIKISMDGVDSVTLENGANWFVNHCRSLTGNNTEQSPSGVANPHKTGDHSDDEKWCVMYGTYRFLRDMGVVSRRTEAFWIFMYKYLHMMGLEDHLYSKKNTKSKMSANSKISTFNSYLKKGKNETPPHYQVITLMSIPLEFLKSLIYK